MTSKKQIRDESVQSAKDDRSIRIIAIISIIMALAVAGAVASIVYYIVSNNGENPFSALSNNANNYLYGSFPKDSRVDSEENGRILRSSDDLQAYLAERFNKTTVDIMSSYDFTNNDYVAFDMYVDACAASDFSLGRIKAERDSIEIEVSYRKNCDECGGLYNVYLVPIEKDLTTESTSININISEKTSKSCDITPNVEKGTENQNQNAENAEKQQ